MQEKTDTVIHAAFTQLAGKRQQMVIMNPDYVVIAEQRQQFIYQQGIHPLIALPCRTLKLHQIEAIMKCRP